MKLPIEIVKEHLSMRSLVKIQRDLNANLEAQTEKLNKRMNQNAELKAMIGAIESEIASRKTGSPDETDPS